MNNTAASEREWVRRQDFLTKVKNQRFCTARMCVSGEFVKIVESWTVGNVAMFLVAAKDQNDFPIEFRVSEEELFSFGL